MNTKRDSQCRRVRERETERNRTQDRTSEREREEKTNLKRRGVRLWVWLVYQITCRCVCSVDLRVWGYHTYMIQSSGGGRTACTLPTGLRAGACMWGAFYVWNHTLHIDLHAYSSLFSLWSCVGRCIFMYKYIHVCTCIYILVYIYMYMHM